MYLKNIPEVLIKIIISPELDTEGFFISKKEIQDGHILFDQFKKSFDYTIGSQVNFDASKEQIFEQVKQYYDSHANIQENFNIFLKKFEQIKEDVLKHCSEIFLDTKLCHQDVITVYPSIWGIGILNMKEEAVSFDIYARSCDEMIYVAIHELMHVFFYSYINNIHKIDFNSIIQKQLWDMAEIFNSVILALPQFRKFYPQYDFNNYPEHEGKIIRISKQISRGTIDEFLKAYIL